MKFVIVGTYLRSAREIIDSAESSREARELVREYRQAFGEEWIIGYRRAPTLLRLAGKLARPSRVTTQHNTTQHNGS